MSESAEIRTASLDSAIPGTDAFARRMPAELELTADALRVSEQVVDFGTAILHGLNVVRPERRIHDLVTAALLRRALITCEAVCVLARRGLLEPAFATYRTLLEIDVALRLALRDSTDAMAKRIALACVIQYKSHGQDMLGNRPTRDGLLNPADRVQEIMSVSRSYAKLVKDPAFDDVREAVMADQHWHGFKNTEDAFRSLGCEPDYHMTYDAASWFVHGVNVEHDLSESLADRPALRALVERHPDRTRSVLGLALLKLLDVLALYIEDRAMDVDSLLNGHATVKFDDGHEERIGPMAALQTLVLREFDVRPDAPIRRLAP